MKRLLIVEDEADTGALLAAYLGDSFVCHHVVDGAAARRALAEEGADILLLDIGLPDVSGFSLATEVRQASQGIWIIALTGRCAGEDLMRSRAAGVDVHIAKPVQARELLRLMESLGERGPPAARLEARSRAA
jgi:DNA-binding response OmpR family regulator